MHMLTNFLSIQYNMLLIYGALFSQSSINFVTGSNNCYRYLKNAVQYFFAEIYIVMVLICFHLLNFHTYETFPFSDLHQDILAHPYQFYFIEIQNTMQRDFSEHNIFVILMCLLRVFHIYSVILILFQHRIFHYFEHIILNLLKFLL